MAVMASIPRNLLQRRSRQRCSISLHDEKQSHEIVERMGHNGREQASLHQEQPTEIQPHEAGDDRIRRRREMGQTEEDAGGEKRQGIGDHPPETGLDHAAKQELLTEPCEGGQERELCRGATSEYPAELANHEVDQPAQSSIRSLQNPDKREEQWRGGTHTPEEGAPARLQLRQRRYTQYPAQTHCQQRQSRFSGQGQAYEL
jgi:hypothetical protein